MLLHYKQISPTMKQLLPGSKLQTFDPSLRFVLQLKADKSHYETIGFMLVLPCP